MKTFADLTDEQLIALANLAINVRHTGYPTGDYTITRQPHPEKGHVTVIYVKLDNDWYSEEVRFGPVTGDIWRPEGDKAKLFQRVWNQWAIIKLCLEWQVDYLTPRPAVEVLNVAELLTNHSKFHDLRDNAFNR